MNSRVIGRADAAKYIGVSLPTLDRLIKEGKAPVCLHLAKRRRGFLIEDLDNWLSSKRSASLPADPIEEYIGRARPAKNDARKKLTARQMLDLPPATRSEEPF
jgi:predicted DNA-binding transcriptional regulator AlpA